MLGIQKTLLARLVADGTLASVLIGRRRLIRIDSVKKLAGVGTDQASEAPQ
jgi:hypothetical protein